MSNQIDMKALLQQAENMQSRVQAAHEALKAVEVRGEGGEVGASVEVYMNGQHSVLRVQISIALLKILLEGVLVSSEQLEKIAAILGQVVMHAINDSVEKVNQASRQKLGELASEIQPNLGEIDRTGV